MLSNLLCSARAYVVILASSDVSYGMTSKQRFFLLLRKIETTHSYRIRYEKSYIYWPLTFYCLHPTSGASIIVLPIRDAPFDIWGGGGGRAEFLLLANFFFTSIGKQVFSLAINVRQFFFYLSLKKFFVVCFPYYVRYHLVFFLVNIFFINFDNKLLFLWRQTFFFNFNLAPPPQISNGASLKYNTTCISSETVILLFSSEIIITSCLNEISTALFQSCVIFIVCFRQGVMFFLQKTVACLTEENIICSAHFQ